MFSSNQILEISGSDYDKLRKTIKFVLDFDGKSIDIIRGIKKTNNYLCFGWVPSTNDNDRSHGFEPTNYSAQYDIVLPSIIPTTENTIIDIIDNWLKSEEIDQYYKNLYKATGYKNWDNLSCGWKVSAYDNDRPGRFECDMPTFTIFVIEPYIEVFDD